MRPAFNTRSASRLSIHRQFPREERWVKHYSSYHVILLVGEGDFSFSLALANAFGSAYNIVATSLDSHDTVVIKYAKAKSNLETLEEMGATVLHGVDATEMMFHTDLKMMKFDRIVYNFPHAGFKGKEDQTHVIDLHRKLVNGFFYNAIHMLRLNGEVHVTHKTGSPYNKWKLDELASGNSLVLIKCADFNINDYPGYSNKRGDGVDCDQTFHLGKCYTYRFGIDIQTAQKMKAATSNMIDVYGRDDGLGNRSGIKHSPATQYLQADCMPHMGGRPRLMCSPPTHGSRNALSSIDADHPMPMRDCARSGIQISSFQQPNLSIGSEGDSRWIGSVLQTSFEISAEIIPGRMLSPPRILSSEPTGVFEDHLGEDNLRNLVRRYGRDCRHAYQKSYEK